MSVINQYNYRIKTDPKLKLYLNSSKIKLDYCCDLNDVLILRNHFNIEELKIVLT